MAGGVKGYLQFGLLMATSMHIWLGGVLGVVLTFLKKWVASMREHAHACSASRRSGTMSNAILQLNRSR